MDFPSDNSNQNMQDGVSYTPDLIEELQNGHYEAPTTDTSDLTSVFIELDDHHDHNNPLQDPKAGYSFVSF